MSLGSRLCLKNSGNLFAQGTFIWQWGTFIWDGGSFIEQGGTFIWQEGTFILRRVPILLQIIRGTKFWSCVRTLSLTECLNIYEMCVQRWLGSGIKGIIIIQRKKRLPPLSHFLSFHLLLWSPFSPHSQEQRASILRHGVGYENMRISYLKTGNERRNNGQLVNIDKA